MLRNGGPDAAELAREALGGRVVNCGFLDAGESASLLAELRRWDVGVNASGGYPGALRRLVTVFPPYMPDATTSLTGVYFPGVDDPQALTAALRTAGVARSRLGDVLRHEEGCSIITLLPVDERITRLSSVAGTPTTPQVVPTEKVAGGRKRRIEAVVPSLRVDALGAKAFRVSRSYFSKGIANRKVFLNGKPATKADTAALGDEVFAAGLGRFELTELGGRTRRGNLRVILQVESV